MKILQLTDLHLFADPAKRLQGRCSYRNLVRVIDYILDNQLNNANAVFITGDLSQDETAGSYQLAISELERLGLPLYIIHGNHDNQATLESVVSLSPYVKSFSSLCSLYWQVIDVDTVQIGQDSGLLAAEQLEKLIYKLSLVDKNKQIILFMHHHPLAVGTPLLDDCMLLENQALLEIINKYEAIKLVICGHAHGNYSLTYQQCAIEVSPATCFQWKKGTSTITIEPMSGFSLFTFSEKGYSKECYFIDSI